MAMSGLGCETYLYKSESGGCTPYERYGYCCGCKKTTKRLAALRQRQQMDADHGNRSSPARKGTATWAGCSFEVHDVNACSSSEIQKAMVCMQQAERVIERLHSGNESTVANRVARFLNYRFPVVRAKGATGTAIAYYADRCNASGAHLFPSSTVAKALNAMKAAETAELKHRARVHISRKQKERNLQHLEREQREKEEAEAERRRQLEEEQEAARKKAKEERIERQRQAALKRRRERQLQQQSHRTTSTANSAVPAATVTHVSHLSHVHMERSVTSLAEIGQRTYTSHLFSLDGLKCVRTDEQQEPSAYPSISSTTTSHADPQQQNPPNPSEESEAKTFPTENVVTTGKAGKECESLPKSAEISDEQRKRAEENRMRALRRMEERKRRKEREK